LWLGCCFVVFSFFSDYPQFPSPGLMPLFRGTLISFPSPDSLFSCECGLPPVWTFKALSLQFFFPLVSPFAEHAFFWFGPFFVTIRGLSTDSPFLVNTSVLSTSSFVLVPLPPPPLATPPCFYAVLFCRCACSVFFTSFSLFFFPPIHWTGFFMEPPGTLWMSRHAPSPPSFSHLGQFNYPSRFFFSVPQLSLCPFCDFFHRLSLLWNLASFWFHWILSTRVANLSVCLYFSTKVFLCY